MKRLIFGLIWLILPQILSVWILLPDRPAAAAFAGNKPGFEFVVVENLPAMFHIPLKGKSITDLSWAGLVMTLGIVYGDLGTSPLYTMQAILRTAPVIDETFILGALSCVFWTLTLQTSFKYVLITLRASNQGEGGIFSLFTLIKKKKRWTFVAAGSRPVEQ